MNSIYVLHDVSNFAVVKLRPDACKQGFESAWGQEMTALVEERQPFAIIFEPEAMEEYPADYRLRGIWFKQHGDRLAAHCAGMICIVGSEEKREEIEIDLKKRARGIGVPYVAAASMQAAEASAHDLLGKVTAGAVRQV